ncbi:hypothetical protein B296_00046203 [Ensete ventricosum]|uniref:Auxin efflux carrier component n=1 Tax=Ensete ventricosum TaxID=4639 RepID=A0A426YN31_ENSVE|nr:hypothetical protein B296_00046203 [Ensete ventricosum]
MALGGFYIWTIAYGLMKNAGKIYHGSQLGSNLVKEDGGGVSTSQESMLSVSVKPVEEVAQTQIEVPLLHDKRVKLWEKLKGSVHNIVAELMTPPTVAAIIGFVVGAIPWLKSLFVGTSAPLRVVQGSIKLLGDGTVPCITLILGGNLTQGFHKSRIKRTVILSIVFIRYVILPAFGIGVVKAAYELGFVPYDPLYRYVLLLQFTVPPAMNISIMAQLFDVGQEECSVIILWTYVVATIALAIWSTIFMWILS